MKNTTHNKRPSPIVNRKIEGQWLITSVTLEKREEAGSRDILAIAPENAKDRLADLQQVKNDTLAH